jgi:hypothetical protein
MERKMDKCTVLIESWEMQCCGTPFKIGDTVNWTVFELEGDAGDYCYSSHHYESTGIQSIEGIAIGITAIYDSHGKEIAEDVNYADGYNDEIEGKELISYRVCLENAVINDLPEDDDDLDDSENDDWLLNNKEIQDFLKRH